MLTTTKHADASAEEAPIKAAYRTNKPANYYSWFDAGNLFIVQERERRLLKRLRERGYRSLAERRVLEIGCGDGLWLREFMKWGVLPGNSTGIDIRPEALTIGARRCPNGVTLQCMNGSALSFDNESFDIVFQSLVFTSVLDEAMRYQMAKEMLRVVKKTGLILWYDFHVDNPWNPNVRGVRKTEIKRLFPNCHIALERVSLALPLAKMVAPRSWIACYIFDRLRVLNTHYLGLIQKR